MTELFNRTASLSVGKTAMTGKKFTGLRIKFHVEKTSESTPNPATVSIYNLSRASRGELEASGLVMVLSAGYAGLGSSPKLESLIFQGDVARSTVTREGPDIVTTLEAGDGEKAIRETHIDMTFSPLTSVRQVVTAMALKLRTAVGNIEGLKNDLYKGGLSLSGLIADHLDVITKKQGLEWNVTDGELNILPVGGFIKEEVFVIGPDSGLIGTPSKSDDGIKFQALLNPKLKPGGRVYVESELINGTFKVRRVSHKGDTHGGPWTSEVEAV